jgi:Golgi nucleoside diphosphatase
MLTGLMRHALAPLLEWAEEIVPEHRWSQTPLFLFGTAGMRQLPQKHREQLLEQLGDVLNASSFRWVCASVSMCFRGWDGYELGI